MKRLAGLFATLLIAVSIHAQSDKDRTEWAASAIDDTKMSSAADRSRILKFDFAPLWTRLDDNTSVLGYIGNEFQRLRIVILTAAKQPNQPDTYNVTGKSMVRNVIRPFSGTIKITKIASSKGAALEEDYAAEHVQESGRVFGEYHFAEDAKQTNTGKFDGFFVTDWIVDKNGKFQYDEVMMGADGYHNNQFVGTWTSYRTKAARPANWGDSRIPLSGDLDMGAGEFAPYEKYVRNGWQGYVDAYGGKQDARALANERRQWWK